MIISTENTNNIKTKKGFTLVELMVVIVIIAMLAGLLLPVIFEAIEKANITDCGNNLRQVGLAVQSYQGSGGRRRSYPANSGKVSGATHASATPGARFVESLMMGKSPTLRTSAIFNCASNDQDAPNEFDYEMITAPYNFDLGALPYLFRDIGNFPIKTRNADFSPIGSDAAGNHNGFNVVYASSRIEFFSLDEEKYSYKDDQDPDSPLVDRKGNEILLK